MTRDKPTTKLKAGPQKKLRKENQEEGCKNEIDVTKAWKYS